MCELKSLWATEATCRYRGWTGPITACSHSCSAAKALPFRYCSAAKNYAKRNDWRVSPRHSAQTVEIWQKVPTHFRFGLVSATRHRNCSGEFPNSLYTFLQYLKRFLTDVRCYGFLKRLDLGQITLFFLFVFFYCWESSLLWIAQSWQCFRKIRGGGCFLDISKPCILTTVGHIQTNMEVLGRLRPHFFTWTRIHIFSGYSPEQSANKVSYRLVDFF